MNRRDFFKRTAPLALAGAALPLAAAVVASADQMPKHTGFIKVHFRPGSDRFYLPTYSLPDGPDRIVIPEDRRV